ncbi:glycosyltransferase family 2 protein [Luteimonas sp. gir]|uniref:glycosyltransferase family 2 protein n=1 Tax=Luteimonas sp. gir TaxID=3127960 RepID=UPI003075DC15
MIDAGALDAPSDWTLVASSQLRVEGDALVSEDHDPHLVFALGQHLEPGWYRLRVRIDGKISLPSLYLDCGAGISEAGRQDLDLDDAGGIDAIVRVWGPLRHVRLDPSTRPGRFSLGSIRFDSVPPSEAVWRMWRALADRRAAHSALSDESAEIRAEHLWPAYRVQDAGSARIAYGHWLSSRGLDTPTAASSAQETRSQVTTITLVLLPGACTTALVAAARSLIEQLVPGVELIVPAAAGIAGSRDVRILAPMAPRIAPGLEQASGRFISWISADERVSRQGLQYVYDALADAEDIGALYTDEDFATVEGRACTPYFKPAWDPDLQGQHDFVGPSSFHRVSLLRQIYSDARGDGVAWAHILPLRIAHVVGDAGIRHLPVQARRHLASPGPSHRPLRSSGASAVQVADALARLRPSRASGAVVAEETVLPRLTYELQAGTRCDIVIPTRDRVELLSACVDSILALTSGVDYEIVVVDNGSSQPKTLAYLDRLREDGRIRVIRDESPFNYSALNNRAVADSTADVVVLLNNDIEIVDGTWLRELAAHACRPEIGAVGAKLLYPDGSLQHAGVILGVEGVAAHAYPGFPRSHPGQFGRALAAQRMSAVTAACLAVRRSVFDEVGGLDPRLAVAFNDVDFCLRVREAGYSNLWLPWVWMYHHESASRGQEDSPEKIARFASEVGSMKARWGDVLVSDPAYNPNLSLFGRAFSIDPARSAAPAPRASMQVDCRNECRAESDTAA